MGFVVVVPGSDVSVCLCDVARVEADLVVLALCTSCIASL